MMKTEILPLNRLHPNNGQVRGLPKNPRFVRDGKFEKLKRSLTDDPEFMQLREIVAYDNGGELVIIGGNMRYRALKDLGVKTAPVKILPQDTSVEKLRAFTIKDNAGFGDWDWDDLANEWDNEQLESWGVDVPVTDADIDIDDFFTEVGQQEDKEQGERVVVLIPHELEGEKENIKKAIQDTLSVYKGIKVQ